MLLWLADGRQLFCPLMFYLLIQRDYLFNVSSSSCSSRANSIPQLAAAHSTKLARFHRFVVLVFLGVYLPIRLFYLTQEETRKFSSC